MIFSFHLCIITTCATTTCVSGLKRCRWWIWLGDQSRKGAAKRRGVPIFNTGERAWLKDTSPRKNRTGPRDIATSEILEGGSLAMSFMRRRWPLQAGLTRRSSWFFVAGCSLLRLSHYSCQATRDSVPESGVRSRNNIAAECTDMGMHHGASWKPCIFWVDPETTADCWLFDVFRLIAWTERCVLETLVYTLHFLATG